MEPESIHETNLDNFQEGKVDKDNEASGFPSSSNVRVLCRFRPENGKEVSRGGKSTADFFPNGKSLRLIDTEVEDEYEYGHSFTFDHIFPPSATQKEIHEKVGLDIADSVLEGYNGTILAYGQTSSGKTYTMEGAVNSTRNQGLVPRIVGNIVDKINAKTDNSVTFELTVSMMEIYLERIRDLIDVSRVNLPIREDPEKGIWVEGAVKKPLNDKEEILEVMRIGQANRATASTKMNYYSSRSHSIFVVNVTQKNLDTMSTKTGKLCLVDLAGSEKVEKTGAKGTRLEEAKKINKSLSTLGNVINALTDGMSTHIPYRDSKLTRVLQESLGGNSKTALIICCSPSPYNYEETLSTLRFGSRMKLIKNDPHINEEFTPSQLKALLLKARDEISRLRESVFKQEKSIPTPNSSFLNPSSFKNNLIPFAEESKEVDICTPESCKYHNSYLEEKKLRNETEFSLQNVTSKLDLLSLEHQAKEKSIQQTLKRSEQMYQKRLDGSNTQIIQLDERILSMQKEILTKTELLHEAKMMITELNAKTSKKAELESIAKLDSKTEIRTLKLKLDKAEEEKSYLSKQNKAQSDSISSLVAQLEETKSNLAQAASNVSALKTKMENIEKDSESEKERANKLLDDNTTLYSANQELKTKLKENELAMTQSITDSKKVIDESKKYISSLEKEISQGRSNVDLQKEENDALEKRLSKQIKKSKSLEESLAELTDSHQSICTSFEDTKKQLDEEINKNSILQQELKKGELIINQITSDKTTLESKGESLSLKYDEAKNKVIELTQSQIQLQKSIDDTRKEASEASSLHDNLNKKYEAVLKEKQELEKASAEKILTLSEDISNLDKSRKQEVLHLNDQIKNLGKEKLKVETLQAEIRKLQQHTKSTKEKKETEMNELLRELEYLKEECKVGAEQNDSLRNEVSNLKILLNTEHANQADLTTINKQQEEKLSATNRLIAQLNIELEDLKKVRDDTNSQFHKEKETLNTKISSLETEVADLKTSSKNEIKMQKDKYNDQVEYADSLRSELENALDKIKLSTKALKGIESEHSIKLQELEEVKTERNHIRDTMESLKNQNKILATQIVEFQSKVNSLAEIESKNKMLLKQINESKQAHSVQVEKMKNDLNFFSTQIEKLQNDNIQKDKLTDNLKQEIDRASSEIMKCTQEKCKLEETIGDHETEKIALQNEISKVEEFNQQKILELTTKLQKQATELELEQENSRQAIELSEQFEKEMNVNNAKYLQLKEQMSIDKVNYEKEVNNSLVEINKYKDSYDDSHKKLSENAEQLEKTIKALSVMENKYNESSLLNKSLQAELKDANDSFDKQMNKLKESMNEKERNYLIERRGDAEKLERLENQKQLELDAFKKENSLLKDQLKLATEKTYSQEMQLTKMGEKLVDVKNLLDEEKSQKEEANKLFQEQNDILERSTNENKHLNDKFKIITDEKAAQESQLIELSEQLEKTKKLLIKETSQICEVNKIVESQKAEIEKDRNMITTLNEECKKAKEDSTKHSLQLTTTIDQLESTKISLEEQTSKSLATSKLVEDQNVEIEKRRDENKKLREQLGIVSEEKNKQQLQLATINEQLQHTKNSLENEILMKTTANKLFEEQKTEAQRNKTELENAKAFYLKTIETLQDEFDSLREDMVTSNDSKVMFLAWEKEKCSISSSQTLLPDQKKRTEALVSSQILHDKQKVLKAIQMLLFEAEIVHKQAVENILRKESSSQDGPSDNAYQQQLNEDVELMRQKLVRRDQRIKRLEHALLDAKYASVRRSSLKEDTSNKKLQKKLVKSSSFKKEVKDKTLASPKGSSASSRKLSERVRSVLKLHRNAEVPE